MASSKLLSMHEAIAEFVPEGASVALGLQMEQMIPFAAGCVDRVIAAWVGNVMMGSAYNFRRAVEQGNVKVINMSNFTVALALQAAALGVPFLPTRTGLGSDVVRGNEFFAEIESPFAGDETGESATRLNSRERLSPRGPGKLHAVKALSPDVAIVHLQRADRDGNAH